MRFGRKPVPPMSRCDSMRDMTDARIPERWLHDRRLLLITPESYRCFISALLYMVGNRTDGYIKRQELPYVYCCPEQVTHELVTAGLWETTTDGFRMVDFDLTQTSRAEIEAAGQARVAAREAAAERKRRQRSRVTEGRDSQDRPGQARTGAVDGGNSQNGKAKQEAPSLSSSEPWPDVVRPGRGERA